MSAGLVVRNATVRYGGVVAVNDVSLAIPEGRVVGLIGPNGAGKTSLVNAITGVAPLASGTIALGDRTLAGRPTHAIARAGIARTYQNIRLFGALSVRTNVTAGAFARNTRLSDADIRGFLDAAGVGDVTLDALAASLNYGDRRRLEIARALASTPNVLLLDEPAAGMNPVETIRLRDTIRAIAANGPGVLLIEHDMSLVRAVCDDVVVLNFGTTIATGTPESIAHDPAVIEAYLGSDDGVRR
jgi:ABC-type branched-subunit amino acid transport system ATPase component